MTSHFADPGLARRVLPAPRVAGLSAAATVTALVLAAACSEHAVANGPVVCPFRLMTGLPCPGCGMTRAWVLAMHGDVARSVAENPFVVVTLPLALAFLAVGGRSALLGRPVATPVSFVRSLTSSTVGRWTTWSLVAAWIAFGIVRATLVATGHLAF